MLFVWWLVGIVPSSSALRVLLLIASAIAGAIAISVVAIAPSD